MHTAKSLEIFKKRRICVLVDDVGNEPRSVLVSPAALVDSNVSNEILSITGGLFFVAMGQERISAFMLQRMARPQTAAQTNILSEAQRSRSDAALAICVSVEAREGISTGISSFDRSVTVQILGEDTPQPRKLVKPGHIFPVETKTGGVLVKNSLAEGAVDLARAAGFTDAALFVDLLDAQGEIYPNAKLNSFCAENQLPCVTLSDLIRYRLETEVLVQRIAEAKLPTSLAGEVRSVVYRSSIHSGEHVALIKGQIDPLVPTLTRVQPEFTFADVFGGSTPPTRKQIRNSLAAIGKNGSGVLIYLRRPSAGQLGAQIRSRSVDAPPPPAMMMREYGLGAQILRDLGVKKIELLSSGKRELAGVSVFGIEIVGNRPIPELGA